MRTLATALLMMSALSACATSPTGAAQARLDAAMPYISPCAGALAGESMTDARRECLPVMVILDGAR